MKKITYPGRITKRHTKEEKSLLARLESYLEDESDEYVEILVSFWDDQEKALAYKEIREAIISGAVPNKLLEEWQQDYSVLVTAKLEALWTKAMETGANTHPVLSAAGFTFNSQSPGAIAWIRDRGAQLVTNSTGEQLKAIQSLLLLKEARGYTVDELSRLIRPCIGLTHKASSATLRLYDTVKETLKRDHPRMEEASVKKKALDAALKYAGRSHRSRALTIAQTEMAYAYNWGTDAGMRQAQEEGLIGTLVKRWVTSYDDNVCDTCKGLDGVEIAMNDTFTFAGRLKFEGMHMLPPAHPNCGCAVQYLEKETPYV